MPRRVPPGKDAPGHDAPGHEGPGHEGPGHDGPGTLARVPAPTVRTERRTRLGLAAAALVAAGLQLIGSRAGLGVNADASNYLAAAEALSRGDGYHGSDGGYLTTFPPGYPVVLAAAHLLVPAPWSAVARGLAALLVAAVAGLTGLLAARAAPSSRLLPVVAALSVATSPALQRVGGWAWSEPLFCCLVLAGGLHLASVLSAPAPSPAPALGAGAAGLLLGAAALTRTVGLVAVVGAVVLLLVRRRPRLALAALGAALPLPLAAGLWCRAQAGVWTAPRGASALSAAQVLHATGRVLAGWLGASAPPVAAPALLVGAAAAAAAAAATAGLLLAARTGAPRSPLPDGLAVAGALGLALLVGTVAIRIRTALDPPDDRLLFPVLPLAAAATAGLLARWGARQARLTRQARWTGAALLVGLVAAGTTTARSLADPRPDPGSATALPTTGSATVAAACRLPPGTAVLALHPGSVAWVCHRAVWAVPGRRQYQSTTSVDEVTPLRARLRGACAVLVWRDADARGADPSGALAPGDLRVAGLGVELRARTGDGALYDVGACA